MPVIRLDRDNDRGRDITVEVFAAIDMVVCRGIRLQEPLGTVDSVTEGDVFQLRREARPQRIALPVDGRSNGCPSALPVARHRLMSMRGEMISIVVLLREGELLIVPQSPLLASEMYTLIDSTEEAGPLEGLGPVVAAFSAGTSIFLGDGRSCAIERLKPGDMVLTRDNGGQPLRWIGRSSMAAGGPLSPIVFRAGSMGNLDDLIVAPTHRMFIFPHSTDDRWSGLIGTRHGVLVEARHLVDNATICPLPEGIVDLYALVFDRHEVIYAEGVPCESHLVTEATLRQMPATMAAELRERFPRLQHRPHFALSKR